VRSSVPRCIVGPRRLEQSRIVVVPVDLSQRQVDLGIQICSVEIPVYIRHHQLMLIIAVIVIDFELKLRAEVDCSAYNLIEYPVFDLADPQSLCLL